MSNYLKFIFERDRFGSLRLPKNVGYSITVIHCSERSVLGFIFRLIKNALSFEYITWKVQNKSRTPLNGYDAKKLVEIQGNFKESYWKWDMFLKLYVYFNKPLTSMKMLKFLFLYYKRHLSDAQQLSGISPLLCVEHLCS